MNYKHQPNVCNFLLVLEAQILDTAFSSGAERCRSKTFSFLSIMGFALRSTPSFHHHLIIHPVLFILCLIDVKRAISSNHSSCIYHPFTYRIINLFCVSHIQCCAAQGTFRYFELCSICLKVHKIENFFDSDFGICVISLIVMSKS